MTDFTSEELAELNKAIAMGVRKVKYQDREIEYNSLDDMIRARDLMRQELGLTGDVASKRKVAQYESGL